MTAKLTTTALFIPLSGILLSIFACPPGERWGATDLNCFEGTHLAWLLIVLVLLPSFAAFSLMVTSVFFERDWRSKSVVSKSHGRSDVIILFTQLMTVVFFVLQHSLSLWVLRIVVLLAGICVLAAVLHTLPFHKPAMNAYRAATAAIFLWASVAANIKAVMVQPEAAAYMFWLGLPIVIIAAAQTVYMQIDRFSSTNAVCRNPFHAEIRVRLLHGLSVEQQMMTKRLKREILAGQLSSLAGSTELQVPDEIDSEAIQDARVSALVEAVYIRSTETMAASSFLYLFYAQYLHSLGGGKHRQKESLMLNKAEQRSPAFDVSFLIWQRRKQMEEDDTAAEQGHMNVLTRVAFDKHMKDALNSGALARKHLVQFWTELKSKMPDLGRLYELGGTLNDSISKTESAFSSLLSINRRNVDVLRKYAGFVADVLNHPSRAQLLLDEASNIEERSTKLTKLKHSNFDFGDIADASQFPADLEAGVYTMGHMGQNAGRIVAMNAAASRQSGFVDSDLIGREAGLLLPQPFEKWFNVIVYEALGDGSGGDGTFLDQLGEQEVWRFMLMLDSRMFLLPVAVSVRWNADGINAITYRVNSSKGFMVVNIRSSAPVPSDGIAADTEPEPKTTLLACCPKSLDLIGLSDLSSGSEHGGCLDLLPLDVTATFPGLSSKVFASITSLVAAEVSSTQTSRSFAKVSKLLKKQTQQVVPGAHLPVNGSRTPAASSRSRRTKAVDIDIHLVRSHLDSEHFLVVSWIASRETMHGRRNRPSMVSMARLDPPHAVREEPNKQLTVQPVSMNASPAYTPKSFARAQTLPTQQLALAINGRKSQSQTQDLHIPSVDEESGFNSPAAVREESSISRTDSAGRAGSIRINSATDYDQKLGAQSSIQRAISKREDVSASIGPESVGGSTASSKNSFSTLRRLLTQRNKHIDPKLKFLRSSFFYIFLFAAAAFVANAVLVGVFGKTASAALILARKTAKRLEVVQKIALITETLAVTGMGGLRFESSVVQSRLLDVGALAASLEAINQNLYEDHSRSLSASDHFSHYHSAEAIQVQTVSLFSSPTTLESVPRSMRSMSLLSATAAYVGALRSIAGADPTMFDNSTRVSLPSSRVAIEGLYMVLSSTDGIYQAMNATHISQLDVATKAVSTLIQIPAESVLVCAIVFDILMVALIAPTIQSLEETKDNVLKTFLFLPRKLVHRIHADSTKRLVRAQREARGDNGSSDESVDDVEQAFKHQEVTHLESSNENAMKQLGLARTNSKLHIMHQKSSLWDTVQVRRHTKSLRVFLVLMTRFSAPILLLLAYLAGSYAYQKYEMDNLQSVAVQVSMSDARLLGARSLARSVVGTIHPRNNLFSDFLLGTMTQHNVSSVIAPVAHTLELVSALQQKSQRLLFGDPVIGLRPSVITAFKTTDTLSPAYLEMADTMGAHFLTNGCASASNSTQCQAVLAGRMSQGASFGLNELQEQVTSLLMTYSRVIYSTADNSTAIQLEGQVLLAGHPGRLVGTRTIDVVGEALEYASMLYTAMLESTRSNFVQTMNVVTALIVVALFLFYALLYRPSIRQVDKDIARTTGMLLMLPMDAVSKSPVVSEMIISAVKSLKQSVSQTM